MTFKITQPPIRSPFDSDRGVSSPWVEWTNQIYTVVNALAQSGPTAQRPTKLYVGQTYFDTSLGANGKPIWVNKAGTGWVLADGTAA